MATSGITANQLTRNEYVEAACRKLGVVADGQTLSATNYTNGSYAFNALIGEFRALGMPLWARSSYTFTPTSGTSTYNIGSSQTLNTPYPLKMLQAFREDSNSNTRIPINVVADFNFNLYPSGSSGLPIQLTYQPKVNYGVIKLWPTPDDNAATGSITIVYQRPTEYVASATDTVDVPEEWTNALIYNLAVRLAPEWGIALPDRDALKKEAKELLDRALEFGTEDGSLYFQPTRTE